MKKDEPIEKHHEFTDCCRDISFSVFKRHLRMNLKLNDFGVTDTFSKLGPSYASAEWEGGVWIPRL